MKRLILILFLISSLFGCAFSGLTNCKDSAGNGVACSSLVANLEVSENMNTLPAAADNTSDNISVERDELSRLMAQLNIDSNVTKTPTLIPQKVYKVLVLPYASGNRYYAGRYIFITAGKSKWVQGRHVLSSKASFEVDTPVAVKTPIKAENIINIPSVASPNFERKKEKKVVVKHKVNAYLLNCRQENNMESPSIAVFDQDRILDIVDKSSDWWEVSFYEKRCYVNSKYLYSEPEK